MKWIPRWHAKWEKNHSDFVLKSIIYTRPPPTNPSFQLTPSPTAQILLIFGFMHLRVAAGRLLRLKSISLSATHRIHVRRLLIHVLKLSVWGELGMLVGSGPVNVHHVRHTAFGNRRWMSTNGKVAGDSQGKKSFSAWTLYCCFAVLAMLAVVVGWSSSDDGLGSRDRSRLVALELCSQDWMARGACCWQWQEVLALAVAVVVVRQV